jgi:hypothetical protein
VLLIVGGSVVVTASLSRPRGAGNADASPPSAVADPSTSVNPLVPIEAQPAASVGVGGADEVTFANADIAPISGANTRDYTFGADPQVKRRPDGEPAAFIASRLPDSPLPPMPGMRGWFVPAAAWQGKRVEVSAYLRTQDVRYTTGMNVIVFGARRRLLASDINGGALRISGTNEWSRMSSVLDVPADAQRIEFGVGLWGSGRVWIDSFAMRQVPSTVPMTSDAMWHLSTHWLTKFRLAGDSSEPHAGRPTARLDSTAQGVEAASLMRIERALDEYRGRRVRVSAMIKAKDVTGGAGVFAKAGGFQADPSTSARVDLLRPQRSFDGGRRYVEVATKPDLPVRGSSGWLKYAAALDVPAEADILEYGVRMEGAGTLWIDDIVLEALP